MCVRLDDLNNCTASRTICRSKARDVGTINCRYVNVHKNKNISLHYSDGVDRVRRRVEGREGDNWREEGEEGRGEGGGEKWERGVIRRFAPNADDLYIVR